MDSFKVGDVILGKYEVTGILGKGGMGLVLAAHHRRLGELVALKFLLSALRENPELCARFAQEARTLIRIKNQHVARVFDVDTIDGVPFIVMEHLTGQDLAAMIRKRGPLPIDESADLLLQACEAINEAHALGIVHRDLKPGNLFVTTAPDGTAFIKVLDFGISKTTALDDVSVTASRAILGSPLYMSPEQLAASRSVDARSDVWSLGVILYEMLAGTPPFSGDSIPTIHAAILGGRYRRLADHRPDIPPALEQMLAGALARRRDARLPTVEVFAARLAPFATEAGRASYARIQRLASRAQAVSAPAVEGVGSESLAPAVGGCAVTRTGEGTTPTFVRSQATTEPSSRRRLRTAALGVGVSAAAVVLAVAIPRVWRASAVRARIDPMRADAAAPAECASGATAACEAACASKQPDACEALAKALAKGVGAPQDLPRAANLYETACAGGSLAACNNLGALYARGEGVARDDDKAVALYSQACEKGYPLACVNLGAAHYEGNGVPKNEALGARFFFRSCEAGVPQGCLNVSVAYGEGRGVPKDPGQAVVFADRACTGGVAAGCVRLGMAKIKGEGVAKDVHAGLAQLEGLCARGESVGCESLAKLYDTGVGADIPADPLREIEYRKKACDLGAKRSCDADQLQGTIDSTGSTLARVNALYEKQCDAGRFVGCGLLGENLLAGVGASVDRDKGIALLEKGCRGGFERACKRLAEERDH